MTATLPVTAQVIGQGDACDVRTLVSANGAGPEGARRGASLTERGYIHARFGGMPVLVGPELASQLKALRQQQPRQQ